jgi:two-component system cell cycle response regulator DivK
LVVDDNGLNLKLARVVLSNEGFEVQTAGDVPEARKVLDSFRPDLILMDIQLPGVDGLEFTRELKASATTQEIVIVALTSYAMRGDEEKALASGCQGYLTKPIDTRTLSRALRELLARYPR